VLGQNNWIGDQVDMPGVVDDWFSEIRHYDHARNRCSSGESCTDYTQVIRRTSSQEMTLILSAADFIESSLFICFICLFVCLFVCLLVCLFVCLFVR